MELPGEPGSYILELVLPENTALRTGRLGEFEFLAGRYIYLGSAQSPGGLRARLSRHLHPTSYPRKLHWHIDYLRRICTPVALCYLTHALRDFLPVPLECLWSKYIYRLSGSQVPAPGFGSSDCKSGCKSHLYYFTLPVCDPILSEAELRQGLAKTACVKSEMLHFQPLAPGVK
jgi:Uri superfamily endonuclease